MRRSNQPQDFPSRGGRAGEGTAEVTCQERQESAAGRTSPEFLA
ncbi:hypothetical protein ACFPK5_01105 [Streptomyces beijiangensis]